MQAADPIRGASVGRENMLVNMRQALRRWPFGSGHRGREERPAQRKGEAISMASEAGPAGAGPADSGHAAAATRAACFG